MSGAQSIATRRAYGVQRVCRVWHRARSSVYARRQATRSPARCRRRGPIGAAPDDVLVAHLRRVLEASPFHGEGYRKAWAKLRVAGMRRPYPAMNDSGVPWLGEVPTYWEVRRLKSWLDVNEFVPHPVPWTHICAMPPGVAHTPRAPRSAFDTQASRDARSGCTAPRSRPRRRGRPRGSERFGRGSLAP